MKMRFLVSGIVFSTVLYAGSAFAGIIPYPNGGTPNPVTYTFTAASTGDIVAYFAGSGAAYDEQVGMLVNGVPTGVVGLDDQTSGVGQALNLGHVNAGDTLTFFDDVFSINTTWYSNPGMNADGGNHVYSTSAAANQISSAIPAGIYVAFEDLDFRTGSDYNYFDDTFVFTNTAVTSSVPELSTWAMLLLGFAGLGFAGYRRTWLNPVAFGAG